MYTILGRVGAHTKTKNKSKEWGRVVGRAGAHRHWKVRFLGMKQKIKKEIKKKKLKY